MSRGPKYWNTAKRYLLKKDKIMEQLINKYGNNWWEGLEKSNPKLMDKLSFYDQLILHK